MTTPMNLSREELALGSRLSTDVLSPLKGVFVGKDEVIDVLGVCLAAGENAFLLGPPGTAKSALVNLLSARIDGRSFDYLLTRFTEPNELFGPFDIRKLREGDLVTNTEGMLPEAEFVFLDELLNANSAILNSLLMVLNERVFRRGRETRRLPTLMVVGASNGLPEDEALRALFDRFLLRVRCDNVDEESLPEVLAAGWRLERQRLSGGSEDGGGMTVDEVRQLQTSVGRVDLAPVLELYTRTVGQLRATGLPVSDRRAVKLLKLIAASALLCGRASAVASDLWVLRYIWDLDEQRETIATIVQQTLKSNEEEGPHHPRAVIGDAPDPERLATELETLAEQLGSSGNEVEQARLRDRLGYLQTRVSWVVDDLKREHLGQQIAALWDRFEEPNT